MLVTTVIVMDIVNQSDELKSASAVGGVFKGSKKKTLKESLGEYFQKRLKEAEQSKQNVESSLGTKVKYMEEEL